MLPHLSSLLFFFFNDTATTEIYTLSLHDALPICLGGRRGWQGRRALGQHLQRGRGGRARGAAPGAEILGADRLGREGRVGARRRERAVQLCGAGGEGPPWGAEQARGRPGRPSPPQPPRPP